MVLSPIHRKLAAGLTLAFLWMWPVQCRALDQKTPEPRKAVSGPPSGAIPLGEVPMHATEALDFLHSLKAYELPNPEIEEIEKALPEAVARIGCELAETKAMLKNQPTLFSLQAKREHWRQLQMKMTRWLEVAKEPAAQLSGALQRVEDLRNMWAQTLASSQASNAPDPVVRQIESTIAAIEAEQRVLQPQYDAILDLQLRIAAQKVRCDNAFEEIAEAQSRAVGGIMTGARQSGAPICGR